MEDKPRSNNVYFVFIMKSFIIESFHCISTWDNAEISPICTTSDAYKTPLAIYGTKGSSDSRYTYCLHKTSS